MRDRIRSAFVALGVVALMVAGFVSPVEAANRAAVVCSTQGHYSKTTKKTTVTVKTNRPTSKKKFDYRLQTYDKAGNIVAIWVKNQGMKITVAGNYFGGYAYQGVDQCSPFGVGVGLVSASYSEASSARVAGKVIKCRTKLVRNSSTKVTATVVNLNGTGTKAKVHSVIFEYSDGDGFWTVTRDAGYGPSMSIGKHNGSYFGYGYLPFAATTWQAGTKCARSYVTAG